MNLKAALMELGNRLVTEHRFHPATSASLRTEWDSSTWPIREFTEWLNRCQTARNLLAEMGYEWPVDK
jgi:hypothetical protein